MHQYRFVHKRGQPQGADAVASQMRDLDAKLQRRCHDLPLPDPDLSFTHLQRARRCIEDAREEHWFQLPKVVDRTNVRGSKAQRCRQRVSMAERRFQAELAREEQAKLAQKREAQRAANKKFKRALCALAARTQLCSTDTHPGSPRASAPDEASATFLTATEHFDDGASSSMEDSRALPKPTRSSHRRRKISRIDRLMEQCNDEPTMTEDDIHRLLTFIDEDGSGEIDLAEWDAALRAGRKGEVEDRLQGDLLRRIDSEMRFLQLNSVDLFRALDTSGDGCLSLDELKAGLELVCYSNVDESKKQALLRAKREAQERRWKLKQESIDCVKTWLERPDSLPAAHAPGHMNVLEGKKKAKLTNMMRLGRMARLTPDQEHFRAQQARITAMLRTEIIGQLFELVDAHGAGSFTSDGLEVALSEHDVIAELFGLPRNLPPDGAVREGFEQLFLKMDADGNGRVAQRDFGAFLCRNPDTSAVLDQITKRRTNEAKIRRLNTLQQQKMQERRRRQQQQQQQQPHQQRQHQQEQQEQHEQQDQPTDPPPTDMDAPGGSAAAASPPRAAAESGVLVRILDSRGLNRMRNQAQNEFEGTKFPNLKQSRVALRRCKSSLDHGRLLREQLTRFRQASRRALMDLDS